MALSRKRGREQRREMIRNPIHLSVGEGRHNHTKITWLAGLQMSLIQMSRIRELLTWPTCHGCPFFCTVGLYTHITDYIINFRAYASRDRSVEPDENIGWSRSRLPYGRLIRHIPDSIHVILRMHHVTACFFSFFAGRRQTKKL